MKTLLRFLVITLLAASAWAVSAQTTVPITSQIGRDGTTQTSRTYPVCSYYRYSITETCIPQSDIMGGQQNLTSLSLYYQSAEPLTCKTNCTVYLKHTRSVNFADEEAIQDLSDATMVYWGSLNCQQGWNEFEFTTPFHYNGVSNLMVIIEDNSGEYQNRNFAIDACHTDTWLDNANTTLAWFSDSQNPDFGNLAGFSGSKAAYPMRGLMRLNGELAPRPLPYVENFDGGPSGIFLIPQDWSIDYPDNYCWEVASNGFGGESFSVQTGHSSPNCICASVRPSFSSNFASSYGYTPWFEYPDMADSIRVTFWMYNPNFCGGSTDFTRVNVGFQSESDYLTPGFSYYPNGNGYSQPDFTRAHDGWVKITAGIRIGRLSQGEPFRVLVGVSQNGSCRSGVLIDDFTVEAVYNNTFVGDIENMYSTYRYPVNNYYKYTLTESVVKEEELQGGAQVLNSIKYFYVGPDAMTVKEFCNIYLQPTNLSSLDDVGRFVGLSVNSRLVYSGPLNCVPGWNEFVFDEPYYYSGHGNLLVIVEDNSGAYNTNGVHRNQNFAISSYPDGVGTILSYSDNGTIDYDSHPMVSESYRPVMCFGSQVVKSLPYIEDFDSYAQTGPITNWLESDADNNYYDWRLLSYCRTDNSIRTHSGLNSLQADPQGSNLASTPIRTSWFNVPDNSELNFSFWMANTESSDGNFTKLGIYCERVDGQVTYFSIPPDMGESGNWRQITFTVPAEYWSQSDAPMRFVFNAIPVSNVGGQLNGLMIDDLSITASRCTQMVYGSDDAFIVYPSRPYTEGFESVTSLNQCGWTPDNTEGFAQWNIVQRPDRTASPVQYAYDGHNFLYMFHPRNNGSFNGQAYSPNMRIMGFDPADSVIIEFMYANPKWGNDIDTIHPVIQFETHGMLLENQIGGSLYIEDGHDAWAKFRAAVPASVIGNRVFQLVLCARPHWGYGAFVDDVKIHLQRQLAVTTHAVPANAGTVTPTATYAEGSEFTIVASPNPGYELDYWYIHFDGNPNNYLFGGSEITMAVDCNQTWTAVFKQSDIVTPVTIEQPREICPRQFVWIQPNNPDYGECTDVNTSLPLRTTVEVSAIPYEGYTFLKWSDGSTQNPRFFTTTAEEVHLIAIFIPNPGTPLTLPYAGDGAHGGTSESWNSEWTPVHYYGQETSMAYHGARFLSWGIWTAPRIDAQVKKLRLDAEVSLRNNTRLVVGVMSDLNDTSTFAPVATFVCDEGSYTNDYNILVDFDSYMGNGQYIAFKMTPADGDYQQTAACTIRTFNVSTTPVFTADESGKKITFAPGNLGVAVNYDFEPVKGTYLHPCQFVSPTTNTVSPDDVRDEYWNRALVTVFRHSVESSNYGITIDNTADGFTGAYRDFANLINAQGNYGTGWCTLKYWELYYIINNRTINGGTGLGHTFQLATVGGKTGMVIFPDNYTGDTQETSFSVLPDGCVFLPTTRMENSDEVGSYWVETASDPVLRDWLMKLEFSIPGGGSNPQISICDPFATNSVRLTKTLNQNQQVLE